MTTSTRAAAAVAAALTTMFLAGVASAGDGRERASGGSECYSRPATKAALPILVVGYIPGDQGQCRGRFSADVYVVKGKPQRLTFVGFDYPDLVCTPSDPSDPPFMAEFLGISLPTAKLKKQGNKYSFHTEEGGSTMSGTVSKSGKKLRADVELRSGVRVQDETVPCEAKFELKASQGTFN